MYLHSNTIASNVVHLYSGCRSGKNSVPYRCIDCFISAKLIVFTIFDIILYLQSRLLCNGLARIGNTLVGFLIGMFISVSVSRWWQMRSNHWQKISTSSRNLIFMISCVLARREFNPLRVRIARSMRRDPASRGSWSR